MLQALVYSIKNTLISFTPEFTKTRFLQPCVLYWCLRSCKLQPKLFLQSSIRACLCVPSFLILSLPFPWKREENWLGLVWFGCVCLFVCLLVCFVSGRKAVPFPAFWASYCFRCAALMRRWRGTKASPEVGMAQHSTAGSSVAGPGLIPSAGKKCHIAQP